VISFDFSQVVRWSEALDAEAIAVGRRVETAVAAQTAAVTGRAIAEAPVGETKQLRGSIKPAGRGLRRRVRAGGGKAYYARFHEFGTRKMSANPFLLKQANARAQAEFEKRVDLALGAGSVYR
jgi:HK97 gp10 family phage protein